MKYNGLTDKQVEESRSKFGSNEIPDSEPTTFWEEFKETFSDQDPAGYRSTDDRDVLLWVCGDLRAARNDRCSADRGNRICKDRCCKRYQVP